MEWKETKLSEVTLKIASGSTPRGGKESYKESGITLIRSMNIYDFNIKYKDLAFIDETQAKKLSNVIIEKNDILLNITGASVGRCAMVPTHLLPARINQHVMIIRIDKQYADASFILYMINAPQYKLSLMSLAETGATREALTKDDISNFKIKLPPLKTQQKIASMLSNYDKLIENNTQRIKLLESMAEEMYKEWFVRLRFPGYEDVEVVNGLPVGWERNTLNNICEITSSKRIFLSDYTSEGIPFYRGKEITLKSKNELVGSELFISDDKFHAIDKSFGSPSIDDILITAVGTLGSIYLVKKSDGNFYFKDGNLIWLKKFKNDFSLYIYYFCKSAEFQHFVDGFAIGSSQKALTIDALKKCTVLYPNINIVNKFNITTKLMLDEIEILNLKNDELKQTRDLLLPRLMSGKLNVEDLDII